MEAGGITQHLSAFTLAPNPFALTLIDTPGHAAFSGIRVRGASITDVALLLVALDNGVQEQTLECIKVLQSTDCPFIVVLNKADKYMDSEGSASSAQDAAVSPVLQARIDVVHQQLSSHNVLVEGRGGDIQSIAISARTGYNVQPGLLSCIEALSEMLDLQADLNAALRAVVLECTHIVGLGICATVLVLDGTLRVHDWIGSASGMTIAKVKCLFDCDGQRVHEATPGMPVRVAGWRNLDDKMLSSLVGSGITRFQGEQEAKDFLAALVPHGEAAQAIQERAPKKVAPKHNDPRTELLGRRGQGNVNKNPTPSGVSGASANGSSTLSPICVILLSDTIGSEEAMLGSLASDALFPPDKARVYVIHKYLAPSLLQSHVEMAAATDEGVPKLLIVAFNVNVSQVVLEMARRLNVRVIHGQVIYHLLEQVKQEMRARLPSVLVEEVQGKARVVRLFEHGRNAFVYGCKVETGSISKSNCLILERFNQRMSTWERLLPSPLEVSPPSPAPGKASPIRRP